MEVSARVVVVICILCSTLSPLASAASFGSKVYKFFNPPVKPQAEPWLINDDSASKGKEPPIRLGILHPIDIGLRTTGISGPLHAGFYEKSCPQAEQIVTDTVTKAVQNESEVAAWLLRLHFNDCFVNGCDASVLLDKTPSGEKTEKLALPNFSLRGYEVIDAVKSELEKKCPGIVSCADTLAFAARDALVLSGVPNYKVLSGRRDSQASREADVLDNLPEASDPLDNTIKVFERKGLTVEDLVVLQGAHSIGVAHCRKADQGLCQEKFVTSMIRMGNIGVLTGTQGEIRKICSAVN